MASLITSGTTEDTSADFTATAGTPVTVFLHDAAGPSVTSEARAVIQIKSSGAQYITVGELSGQKPALVIDGPGTFRVQKYASTTAFGVDKE